MRSPLRYWWIVLSLALGSLPAQPKRPKDTENIRYFGLRSELLSKFWGREMRVEAGVVLPPGHKKTEGLPVCYSIHGFGGSYKVAWLRGRGLVRRMGDDEEPYPRMIYVFLQAHFSLGHHVFADSVNNGPWGAALTREFIPALEKEFGAHGKPSGRFLTGHSSGGWSSLWLQVTYNDFFGGTWSTAPDSVDFKDFTGINVYKNESAYEDEDELPIQLMRRRNNWVMSVRDYVRREQQQRRIGGQFQSFDAVFSPRGKDGRPMPMFDRTTGLIDRFVADSWKRYDISLILQRRWPKQAGKLAPNVHVYMGTLDTFRLEGALYLMRDALKKIGGPQPTIVFAKGRNHGSLMRSHDKWPDGLLPMIHQLMRKRFDASQKGTGR